MTDIAAFSEFELREQLLHARADAEAAEARTELLKADVARLNWFEKYMPDVSVTYTHNGKSYELWWKAKSSKRGYGETLRAAIDDAMQKSGAA